MDFAVLVVSGSRSLDRNPHGWTWLMEQMDRWLEWVRGRNLNPIVVQGGCPEGADRWAREWCEGKGIDYLTAHALWDARGRRAGPMRNQTQVRLAAAIDPDAIGLVVWDGASSGTRNAAAEMRVAGLMIKEWKIRP